MPEENNELGDERNYDMMDCLQQLIRGYDPLERKCKQNKEWGTKEDWIVWFTSNRNSTTGRKFVEMLIATDCIVKNKNGRYVIDNNRVRWRDNIMTQLLPMFKMYRILDDANWIVIKYDEY